MQFTPGSSASTDWLAPTRCKAWAMLLVGAALCSGAYATPPSTPNAQVDASTTAERGPSWASLQPAQQLALQPLRRDWAGIGADHKQKWLDIAAQFPALSPDERQRIQTRMTEWTTLTPQQRGAARLQFKQARQLAPSDRQSRWEAYQALPEDERKALASRAAPVAPEGAASRRARTARDADRSPTGVQTKSNVVVTPETPRPVRPVSPAVVQAPAGATTTLISGRAAPPVHQQAGLPKITASPSFVNPSTLLPQRGPQGAAVVSFGASAPLPRP